MSIFVDKNVTFPIILYYQVVKNDEGTIVGVKILKEDDPDAQKLICQARGCDYDTMSQIMEQVTVINHYTGKPMIRSKMFFRLMLLNFFVSWNATGVDGNSRPITNESVGEVHDRIARAIIAKYIKIIGGK